MNKASADIQLQLSQQLAADYHSALTTAIDKYLAIYALEQTAENALVLAKLYYRLAVYYRDYATQAERREGSYPYNFNQAIVYQAAAESVVTQINNAVDFGQNKLDDKPFEKLLKSVKRSLSPKGFLMALVELSCATNKANEAIDEQQMQRLFEVCLMHKFSELDDAMLSQYHNKFHQSDVIKLVNTLYYAKTDPERLNIAFENTAQRDGYKAQASNVHELAATLYKCIDYAMGRRNLLIHAFSPLFTGNALPACIEFKADKKHLRAIDSVADKILTGKTGFLIERREGVDQFRQVLRSFNYWFNGDRFINEFIKMGERATAIINKLVPQLSNQELAWLGNKLQGARIGRLMNGLHAHFEKEAVGPVLERTLHFAQTVYDELKNRHDEPINNLPNYLQEGYASVEVARHERQVLERYFVLDLQLIPAHA